MRAFAAVRSLLYAAGFVAGWAWLGALARRLDPRLPFTLPAWLAPAGLVIAVAGGIVTAACVATFVLAGRGTPAPFDPPRAFVPSGPYRWVRNPMYLGGAAVILGAGLALRSPGVTLLAAGFLVVLHLFVVLYEEPALAGRFGAEYEEYRKAVRRWLVRRPRPGTAAKGGGTHAGT